MARRSEYRPITDAAGLPAVLGVLAAMLGFGLGAAWYMEHEGHHVTGMTNQVVWGLPHVFAVFLIVAASGALNVASIASVFGRSLYKPLSRLSALLALALLVGGLAVLVLDLGRPDRLVVAMTHYNFRSIFAWNIFLYTGLAVVIVAYLWSMIERGRARYSGAIGLVAFVWRLGLTSGTGLIFGFLAARQTYDAAVMAPLFIAMSFSFGLAVFMLVLLHAASMTGRPIGDRVLSRLGRLQALFVAAVLYFLAVQYLTAAYGAGRQAAVRFILLEGGVYTLLFWVGHVGLGGIVPLTLLLHPARAGDRRSLTLAAAAVAAGGLALVYVIIIGGQAWPLQLFPGMEVRSSFYDGVTHRYVPGVFELALGLGGVAMAGLIVAVGARLLPILPMTLADAAVDPHHKAPEKAAEPATGPAAAGGA